MRAFDPFDAIVVATEDEAQRVLRDEHRNGVVVTYSHVPEGYITIDTRRRVVVDESPSPAQAAASCPPKSRQERWDQWYWQKRYLKHLTLEELGARYVDIFLNLYLLTHDGRFSIRGHGEDEQWAVKFQHLLREQEFSGRQFLNSHTFLPLRERIRPTYPTTPLGAHLMAVPGLNGNGLWFKLGKRKYLKPLLEHGHLRVSGRKSYRELLDPARRDYEGLIETHSAEGYRITVLHEIDSYVFCSSMRLEPRLFYDFKDTDGTPADACLIIKRPDVFGRRWRDAMKRRLGCRLYFYDGPVKYIDPVLSDYNDAGDLLFAKHFRYTYQQEYRLTACPWPNEGYGVGRTLPSIDVQLGSLEDIAVLVTASPAG